MADRQFDVSIILGMVDNASRQLEGLRGDFQQFNNGLLAIAGVGGGLYLAKEAIEKVVGFMATASKEAAKSEYALFKLRSATDISGNSWNKNGAAIERYIDSLTASTAYSNDEATVALQQMLFYTNDLVKAEENLRIAMNLSVGGMFDLQTAIRMVGLVSEGTVPYMLTKYIPALRELKEELKNDSETGVADRAQLAADALEILKQKAGDMAAGELTTSVGKTKDLNAAFSDLYTVIGNNVNPTIDALKTTLSNIVVNITKNIQESQLWREEQASVNGFIQVADGYWRKLGETTLYCWDATGMLVQAVADINGNYPSLNENTLKYDYNLQQLLVDQIKLTDHIKTDFVPLYQKVNDAMMTNISYVASDTKTNSDYLRIIRSVIDAAQIEGALYEQQIDFKTDLAAKTMMLENVLKSYYEKESMWIEKNRQDAIMAEREKYSERYKWIQENISDEQAKAFEIEKAEKDRDAAIGDIEIEADKRKRQNFNMVKNLMKAEAVATWGLASLKTINSYGGFTPMAIGALVLLTAEAAIQLSKIDAMHYAAGTRSARGGWAVVGEQGKELVNLPRGASVFSSGETRRMIGNDGMTVFDIHDNYILNDAAIDDLVDRIDARYVRRIRNNAAVGY